MCISPATPKVTSCAAHKQVTDLSNNKNIRASHSSRDCNGREVGPKNSTDLRPA